MDKINLTGLSYNEIYKFIEDIGEKKFRVSQLWSWIYQKRVLEFNDMTNISKELRKKLSKISYIGSLKLKKKEKSSISGTCKYLWQLDDGRQIESVFIPEGRRLTLCISSQVGCPLGCKFCATARMGFIRNLNSFEIVSQVLAVTKDLGRKPTNIVVMGMGEPFLNYDNLIKSLYILNDQNGMAISHRRITISTAGIIPRIYQYLEEENPFKLALSLNATTDSARTAIMPVNKKYPLDKLMKAAKNYTKKSKKRITFEYILLKKVNDSPEDAERLLNMLKKIKCKLNLITYNQTSGGFSCPQESRIKNFTKHLKSLHAPVILRLSKGDDIKGACGQLAGES